MSQFTNFHKFFFLSFWFSLILVSRVQGILFPKSFFVRLFWPLFSWDWSLVYTSLCSSCGYIRSDGFLIYHGNHSVIIHNYILLTDIQILHCWAHWSVCVFSRMYSIYLLLMFSLSLAYRFVFCSPRTAFFTYLTPGFGFRATTSNANVTFRISFRPFTCSMYEETANTVTSNTFVWAI